MTYIIDLQRLWQEKSLVQSKARYTQSGLDPQKKMVSVILVVNPTEYDKFLKAMHSVLAQPFVREIIIVNNQTHPSVDALLNQVAHQHPKCTIVAAEKEVGLPDLFNQGAQYASSPYLLFLDSNCVLSEDAVFYMLLTGLQKPGPWIIGAQNNDLLPLRLGIRANPMNIKRHMPEVSLPGGGFHIAQVHPQYVFMSSNTFMDLRGMDKNCFDAAFHYDLCLRVHLGGGGVYSPKDIRLVDFVEPIKLKPSLRREWQAFRGWCHFYRKHEHSTANKLKITAIYSLLMLRFLVSLPKVALSRFS